MHLVKRLFSIKTTKNTKVGYNRGYGRGYGRGLEPGLEPKDIRRADTTSAIARKFFLSTAEVLKYGHQKQP